jgi:hypothetical protein
MISNGPGRLRARSVIHNAPALPGRALIRRSITVGEDCFDAMPEVRFSP